MHKGLLLAVVACASATPLAAQTIGARTTEPRHSISPVDDPALVALVRATLADHPEALAAEARVAASRALEDAARRPVFNPELGVDLDSAETNDHALTLTQTLDVAGRRRARTGVAEAEREIAEQGLAAVRRNLAVELLSTLADYWLARERDALAVLRVDLMQRFADVARQRRQAGDLSQVDLNVAVLAHSEARIDSATAGADLAEAERTLAALAPTAGARAWPQLPDDLAPIELGPNDARALIAAVPEVRLQRDRVAAADAAVTLRERERRASPTLRLVGGEEDGESMIGVGFSMPLNVRNRFEHEVEAARASSVQAERELDNVTVRARAALEAAAARYGLTRAAWREWLETGAPNLAEQTALLDRLWRAGELDVTDYLVQLDQTLATQASALDLELRLRRAWLDWLAASAQLGDWLGTSIETL